MAREAGMGERIAELREDRAVTQVELAKKAGISPSTLSLIESGKVERPHRVTIRRISQALGVEPQQLREKPLTQNIYPETVSAERRVYAPERIEHKNPPSTEEWVRIMREVEALVRDVRDLQQGVENGEVSESFALKRIAADVEPLERVLVQ